MDKLPEVAGNKKMVRAGGPHFNVVIELQKIDKTMKKRANTIDQTMKNKRQQ